jgi:DNA-binding transcriptional LysR family regulator
MPAASPRKHRHGPKTDLAAGMELRQLRYFVTLAAELHFGRAAEREHIVQSALSQQVQRLERELGVRLVERSTHHVALTTAGAAFLVEARQILAHTDRAAQAARSAVAAAATLRVGIIDASYDSMPQILHEVQARHPGLIIHQVEVSVPAQYQQLADGRLDVGVGRAALAPPQISSLLFRQDPLGVLVPASHRFAGLEEVPVAVLATEPLLLSEEARAPEFNQFTVELCRAAGFTPTVYAGTVESIRAAADLVAQGRCLYCVPASCIAALPGTVWRPLTEPASRYPWSVLWRATQTSSHVRDIVSCARAMSRQLGWLTVGQTAQAAGSHPAGTGQREQQPSAFRTAGTPPRGTRLTPRGREPMTSEHRKNQPAARDLPAARGPASRCRAADYPAATSAGNPHRASRGPRTATAARKAPP